MRRSSFPTTVTQEKLEKIVQAGNYYEAQQMYKSLYVRYITAQKYEEALNLMQSGASIQLRHGQVTCGAELAILFVETLMKAKIPCTPESLDRIGTIFSEFPQVPVPHKLSKEDDLQKLSEILLAAKVRVDGCTSFLKAAIKWSAAYGGPSKGAAELYDMLAQYITSQSPELWKQICLKAHSDLDTSWMLRRSASRAHKYSLHASRQHPGPLDGLLVSIHMASDLAKASKYFVNGSHPKAFAIALVDFLEKSYLGEADLGIARGVLMYLASGDLRDANCLIDELRKQSTLKEIELPSTPLLQFVEYLLLTLERDALPLLQLLRKNYKSSIDRDSSFNELLDEIAERFYGVRHRSGLQSILGDMLKMIEN